MASFSLCYIMINAGLLCTTGSCLRLKLGFIHLFTSDMGQGRTGTSQLKFRMEDIPVMLTLTAICLSLTCPTSTQTHLPGTRPLLYIFHFSAENFVSSRNWERIYKLTNGTSSSHGLSLRSRMMSKPRTSKQTLSLPGGCPGRHIRYAWSTWGSATISVFTTSSCHKREKQTRIAHKSTSAIMFSLNGGIFIHHLTSVDFEVMGIATVMNILEGITYRRWNLCQD